MAGWWKNIWNQRAQDWTYLSLSDQYLPHQRAQSSLEPEKTYLNIFLRSMRVVNVRTGLTKFYGMAHSYISLPHLSGKRAQFHCLAVPPELQNIDPSHLDRVITLSKRLLGPVPYYGGDVEMELGLFSVKSTDLAGPFLKLLDGLSTTAGVSFIGVARPFVASLLQGVNLLASTQEDSFLEIGLTKTFEKPGTGYFAIIRVPHGAIDANIVKVQDETYRLIDATTGVPLAQYPYMVISIEASEQRDDWFLIPELASVYKMLQEELRTGHVNTIKEAQAIFNRTVHTCLDLIPPDAERLISKVNKQVEKAFSFTLTSGKEILLPEFKDLNLYDRTSPL